MLKNNEVHLYEYILCKLRTSLCMIKKFTITKNQTFVKRKNIVAREKTYFKVSALKILLAIDVNKKNDLT